MLESEYMRVFVRKRAGTEMKIGMSDKSLRNEEYDEADHTDSML